MALWLLGTSFLGYYFSRRLQSRQISRVKELTVLVAENFDRELFQLRQQSRLLASRTLLTRAVTSQDITALRQEVLPLSSILDDDWIGIFDADFQLLLDVRQPDLKNTDIFFGQTIKQVVGGSDVSTLIESRTQNLSLLIGAVPIKNEQGIVGGVFLGRQLSGQLLSSIANKLDVELIALGETSVIAHSFETTPDIPLIYSQTQQSETVTIDNTRYFQASLPLKGVGDEQVTILVLGDRTAFERSLYTVWLTVGAMVFIGTGLAIVVGYWVGNYIAQPIRELAKAADQVSQDANFNVRVAVPADDEVGTLARSLNRLIEWSGFYTTELEIASTTLELRVRERTQELELALNELKETQLQLIQTEKMSSLGQMVAGIAHEINNPINFIQGNAFHLRSYFEDLEHLIQQYQAMGPPTPEIQATLEDIDLDFLLEDIQKVLASLDLGTKRVKDIVIALRNFSRLDEADVKDVDIHEGLESTLLILHHRLKYKIEVLKDYGQLPLVRCYPAQLNQVFTNMIANAIDAMDETNCPKKQLTITTQAIASDKVQISFQDTGPGMPPEVKRKIFDPFFTTKAVGKGTGLGLGICYQIIQKHSGCIDVISEPEKGTAFIVTLPVRVLPE